MATIASLNVLVGANVGPMQRNLAKGENSVRKFSGGLSTIGSGIGGMFSALLGPVGLAIGGVALATKSMSAFAVQDQAVKKLNGVLEATGNVTGFTSNELQGMASKLQEVTNFGDETTIAAMGVLATFKEIRGDHFREATEAAQDMSAVLGNSLQGSVIQLGKALNDPTKGIAALSKAGVSFTAQQKNQIKTMQTAGDLVGAQAIILAELKSEFGGAAKAMADPLTQFSNSFGDTLEVIGGLVRSFSGVALSVAQPILTGFTSTLAAIATPVRIAGEFFSTTISDGIAKMVAFATPIWEGFVNFIGTTFTTILDYVSPVLVSLRGYYGAAFTALLEITQATWSGLVTAFTSIADVVGGALNSIGINAQSTGNFFTALSETIQAALLVAEFAVTRWKDLGSLALLSVGYNLVSFANQFVYVFTVEIPGYLDWFGNHWREVFTDIASMTATIATNIFSNLKSLWDGIVGLFSGDGFSFEWTPLTEGFKSAITELPKIAAREIGPLEKELANEVASLSGKVGQDFAAFTAKRTAEIGADTAALREKITMGFAGAPEFAPAAAGSLATPAASDLNAGGAAGDSKVGALTRGSAEAFKAQQGTSNAKRMEDLAKQQLDESKAQTAALDDIAGSLDDDGGVDL